MITTIITIKGQKRSKNLKLMYGVNGHLAVLHIYTNSVNLKSGMANVVVRGDLIALVQDST